MNVSQSKIVTYRLLEAIIGKNRIRNIYLKHCIRVYKSKGLIYIHIPKTGGTSVATAVLGKRAGHFTASEIQRSMGIETFSSLSAFTVVRNPYNRLLSAYHYICNRGGSKGGVRRHFDFTLPAFDSFDTFVKNYLIKKQHSELDILLKPQVSYIFSDNGELLVPNIFKIEDNELIIEYLKNQLGIVSLSVLNRTNTYSTNELDDELKSLIYTYYEEDFKMFNYTK